MDEEGKHQPHFKIGFRQVPGFVLPCASQASKIAVLLYITYAPNFRYKHDLGNPSILIIIYDACYNHLELHLIGIDLYAKKGYKINEPHNCRRPMGIVQESCVHCYKKKRKASEVAI